MPQTFQTTRRAEFRDTDAAGIVHFSVFFQWMEEAEHELLRHVGLSVFDHDEQGPVTWPRVAARCDFQQSIRFEETFEIEVRIVRLGGKSVTYDFQFRGQRGVLAAGEMTSVCCRVLSDGSLRSMPIPQWISEKLAPHVAPCPP
jgi:4-hydroxybenzoyl-CoA thioesterase/acyl-CoA thioester hydrolase